MKKIRQYGQGNRFGGPHGLGARRLRRVWGGDEGKAQIGRSRPLTGIYGSAMTSGMGGQMRPLTSSSDW